jgi:Tfp pilus assembly protein PilV
MVEVLISAVLIALIVVGTLTALDSNNKASALGRARSQAQALAEQNEEQLRSEPVKLLSELSESHEHRFREVTEHGTVYHITEAASYVENITATASCTSPGGKAEYIETTSSVTWPTMGATKPVVATSIVSPPAGSDLIASVVGASGEPVSGMQVVSTGPSTLSATTSTDGCAILAVLPGEYTMNVSRTGYVDQNGYVNSSEDSFYNSSFYVVAENTAKKSYQFAPAGELAVNFEVPSTKVKLGETFLAQNTLMAAPAYKTFGEVGKAAATVSSGKALFPFTKTPYSVYAGSCPADAPSVYGQSVPSATVPAAGRVEVTAPVPSVSGIVVHEGTAPGASTEGKVMSGVEGTLIDKGCEKEGIPVKRSFTTNTKGELPYPGLPYGEYTLCLAATINTKPRKSVTTLLNNKPAGVATETIYLGAAKEEPATCP